MSSKVIILFYRPTVDTVSVSEIYSWMARQRRKREWLEDLKTWIKSFLNKKFAKNFRIHFQRWLEKTMSHFFWDGCCRSIFCCRSKVIALILAMFKLALEFKHVLTFLKLSLEQRWNILSCKNKKNKKLGADYLDSRRKGNLEGF